MTRRRSARTYGSVAVLLVATACFGLVDAQRAPAPSEGPVDQGPSAQLQKGDASSGREIFRFETFGNERFWTDAVRVPEGIKLGKVTPMMAMKLGVSVDVDALDAATLRQLVA